jgi:hypothetical protein
MTLTAGQANSNPMNSLGLASCHYWYLGWVEGWPTLAGFARVGTRGLLEFTCPERTPTTLAASNYRETG